MEHQLIGDRMQNLSNIWMRIFMDYLSTYLSLVSCEGQWVERLRNDWCIVIFATPFCVHENIIVQWCPFRVVFLGDTHVLRGCLFSVSHSSCLRSAVCAFVVHLLLILVNWYHILTLVRVCFWLSCSADLYFHQRYAIHFLNISDFRRFLVAFHTFLITSDSITFQSFILFSSLLPPAIYPIQKLGSLWVRAIFIETINRRRQQQQ